MSTPATVPMFAQDGSIGDVPAENVDAALSRGFKRGVNVINKDGQKGTIPLERLGEALQSGMMPEHAMQMRRPMNSNPSLGEQIESGLQDAGNKFLSMVKPGGASPLSQFYNQVGAGARAVQGVASQPSAISKAGAVAAPLVGVDAQSVQQAAQTAGKTGNYGPLASNVVVPPFVAAALSRATGVRDIGPQVDAGEIVKQVAAEDAPPARPLIPAEKVPANTEMVAKLKKVANPDPSDLNFDSQFKEHLPEVLNRAQAANGRLPKTAGEFADAFIDSAKSKREFYYGNIMKPVADQSVGLPQGYAGPTVQGTNLATLSQLDSRLSDINATLNPKFSRGGAGTQQAQAAVSAGDARILKSEAGNIRSTLYAELAKRTGLTPEQIGELRSDWGAQQHIGETIQMSANERFAKQANKEMGQQPLTVNPFSASKEFLGDAAVNAVVNKLRSGSPADRAVRQAMSQVQAGSYQSPSVTPSQPTVNARTPLWNGIQSLDEQPLQVNVSTPADVGNNLQRILQNRIARRGGAEKVRPQPRWKDLR